MFRLSRDSCTSLSVASILIRPFTILYIKTSWQDIYLTENFNWLDVYLLSKSNTNNLHLK
jgi:hypothetical protein